MGLPWTITGNFFVRLPGDARAICSAHHARQKLPAYDRLLDLGRSICYHGVTAGRARSRSISGYSSIADLDEVLCGKRWKNSVEPGVIFR